MKPAMFIPVRHKVARYHQGGEPVVQQASCRFVGRGFRAYVSDSWPAFLDFIADQKARGIPLSQV